MRVEIYDRHFMNPYRLNCSRYSTHQVIACQIGNRRTVLDVGCNEGYLATLAERSNIFYGLDNSDSAVEQARQVCRDAAVYDLNRLADLPWSFKFDTIVLADVLEHVLDPVGVLRFFDRYLAEDGSVIVSLPNVANWQVRLNLLFGKFNYTETGIMDRTHLHFYTFRTARKMIEEGGLKVEKELAGASFFGPLLKLLPMFKRLLATNIILVCRRARSTP